MKKRFLKIIILLATIIIVFSNFSFANIADGDLDYYKPGDPVNYTKVSNITGTILVYIQSIGIIVSVAVLIIIGIKYMIGSVEQRANYKQTLKPYLIGAVILFSGTALPNIIYKILNK